MFFWINLLVVFLIASLVYWLGYSMGILDYADTVQLDPNYRPMFFVSFLDSETEEELDTTLYWGYNEPIDTNCGDEDYLVVSINGRDAFSLISKEQLEKEANGRAIKLVVNRGDYTREKDSSYIENMYSEGAIVEL